MIGVTVSEIRRKEDVQHVRHGEPDADGDDARPDVHARRRAGRRAARRAAAADAPRTSTRCSTTSPGCCSPAAPTSTRRPTAPRRTPSSARSTPSSTPSSSRSCRDADRRRMPDPRHLPRRAGAQRRAPGHPAPAPARRSPTARSSTARPSSARSPATRCGSRPTRSLAQTTGGGPAAGQLLPPPGDRPDRPRPARGRLVARRADRGGRGAGRGASSLGVQWHAETLVADAEQLALFERLVEAATHPVTRRARTPRRSTPTASVGLRSRRAGGLRCQAVWTAPDAAGAAGSAIGAIASPADAGALRRRCCARARAWSRWSPAPRPRVDDRHRGGGDAARPRTTGRWPRRPTP